MNPKNLPDISRRHFFARAGVGLAALATTRLAVAQGSGANGKIRLGLIGCGKRGGWLAGLFADHGGYEIVGVADYFPEAAPLAADKLKLAPAQVFSGLKGYEKMIAQGGLAAVAIISPPSFHPEQAAAAVAAGLNVDLAQPVAVDGPGCQSIAASGAAARGKGKVFLVDFQTRTNEFSVEAIERAHAGAIGDFCFGAGSYHAGRVATKGGTETPEGRWRNWVFDQALSGDIMVEQNSHTLEGMSWIAKDAPPVRCSGTGGRRARVDVGDAWDQFALAFEYANNVGVTFRSRQSDAPGTPRGILNGMFGPKGGLMTAYGADVMIRGGAEAFDGGGKTAGIYKEGAQAPIRALHEQVMNKDATNATVASSVTSNRVALLGRTAASEGRPVTWAEHIAAKKKLAADLSGLKA